MGKSVMGRLCGCAITAILAIGLACGGQDQLQEEGPRDPDEGGYRLTVEELPEMPQLPESSRGKLVTLSAGNYDLAGEWQLEAGFCEQIRVIEMYAGAPGHGTALLILTPDDDPVGDYPIVAAAEETPRSPAALIAVQVFDEPDAFGFQAYNGVLEITEYGDRLSGHFSSTLREIDLDFLTQFVGVFDGIPLEPLTAEYCQLLEDATMAVDSALDEG